jgi:ATP-dependent DNA helicase RecQ
MSSIHGILKQYWGYDAFRPVQEEIIRSVLEGNDTLALLPTGGGKSICFQVPALVLEGICVVISPLIALMKDQVEGLRKRGVPAVAIYSGMNRREIDIALDNCVYGGIRFLYVSPERTLTELFRERLKLMRVSLLAVDEAHCISQWGYDFRPPYLEIAQLRDLLPQVPIIALTATATIAVRQDITDKLRFRQGGQLFQKSFARPNLSYSAFLEEDKERKLLQILRNVPGTAVVYVRNRKRTQELAHLLNQHGVRADFYHAGLDNGQRSARQDNWINNRTRVIVATNAFGMGIDKPDVRVVVHMDLPDTLEAYYQEAGRGGRDEKKAYAVALYHPSDLDDLRRRIELTHPSETILRQVYQALANQYQLAAGSGFMASFDFEIESFQKNYNLPAIETYYALKRLEEAGFVQLNEGFHSPSKLHFPVDKKTLYEFQIANAAYDPLIKLVLRMYGGELFTNFLAVSEVQLGRQLGAEPATIVRMLELLQQAGIVVYDKQKDKPQLTFTTIRYESARLPLDVRGMNQRRERDRQKAEAVIAYLTDPDRCRTSLLLAYFGEILEEPCGVCDHCLEHKKDKTGSGGHDQRRRQILTLLAGQEISLQALVGQLGPGDENRLLDTLREMAGAGEIRVLDNGFVRRTDDAF